MTPPPIYKCRQCRHQWFPRLRAGQFSVPTRCPKCRTSAYDRPRRKPGRKAKGRKVG